MRAVVHAKSLDREGLINGLTNVMRVGLEPVEFRDLAGATIAARGGIIASWHQDSDPFPDLLVVRDEDISDTHAWLSSFFAALSPITQWCRIISQSEVSRLLRRNDSPSLRAKLGCWIGTILAECSAQAQQNINLRELPGTAVLTSATFAAGRSVAIWGEHCDLREIAARHEELGSKLRDGTRPISAMQLLPLWQTLNQEQNSLSKNPDRRALERFAVLFEKISPQSISANSEAMNENINTAVEYIGLPGLAECARGPQLDRLKALDQLARDLAGDAKNAPAEAFLGLAASLIDPGAAVLPDLLRKYVSSFPMAPLWLGAFAGCWSPSRVLSDHQGLGRLISRELLAQSDLEEKPHCDIAYGEIHRWLNGVTTSRLPIRGMAARAINIEISLGVNCTFASGRQETVRNETLVSSNAAVQAENQRNRSVQGTSQVPFLARALVELTKRVDLIDKYISDDRELKRKILSDNKQSDLLGDLKSTVLEEAKSKKSRWRK
jgi:hypothetical protein